MANDTIIKVSGVSKKFRRYASVGQVIKEVFHPRRKQYHQEFWALRNVDFEIKRGESVGIVGRNGSGKSTLLQIICGVLQPTSGTVSVNGRIAALLELGAGFHPEFSGRENVYMNGALMGFSRAEMDERFDSVASFADIGDFIDQPVRTYSSGMFVRLAFAAAINVDPDILVVDEALSVGDAYFQQKCFKRIKDLKDGGSTIILVTHDAQAVIRHTEFAVFLNGGRIIESGIPQKVMAEYHKFVFGGEHDTDKEDDILTPVALTDTALDNDVVHTKSNYNKNESYFGDGRAKILDFELLGKEGEPLTHVFSGDEVAVKVMVEFYQNIEFPGFGIEFKTKDGLLVYAVNSWDNQKRFAPQEKGAIVSVVFEQAVVLVGGEYFVSIGVSDHKEETEILDARMDMFLLRVSSRNNCSGVVDFSSNISLAPVLKEGFES